jgi:multiple sugar transport system ATP-binding protein
MRTEIKKLHQRVGKTTVYVTHDQVEAMTLASRIAVMHHGSVQQFDVPQRVYSRPTNMFVAGFMGSPTMNFLPGTLGSRDDKPCVEIAANGASVALPLARTPLKAPDGGKVVLGIRAEHLYRWDKDLKARKPTVVPLEACADLVEPTGAETIVVLKAGERDIVGRFDPDGAPQPGEALTLAVDMAHACLFDPDTQLLIADAR